MMASDAELPAVCWEILFNTSDKTIQDLIIQVAPENAGLMIWLTLTSEKKSQQTETQNPHCKQREAERKGRLLIATSQWNRNCIALPWKFLRQWNAPFSSPRDWVNFQVEQLHITWGLQKCRSISLPCCVLASAGVEITPRRKPELWQRAGTCPKKTGTLRPPLGR